MLILSRRTNQKILIGDNISIVVLEKRGIGNQVRIGIEAPKEIKICREELSKEIKKIDEISE